MDNRTKGNLAESKVQKIYQEKKYKILNTNYRHRRGEVDIIALSDAGVLVFVEVKYRTSNQFGHPESFVTTAQEQRIKEVAEEFIIKNNWIGNIRFDIVSVESDGRIDIFEDAF